MAAPWNVVSVKAVGPLTLFVEHRDGVKGHVRFLEAHLHGVFEALRDPDYFKQVGIKYGAVTWPGELDIAPDAMHDEIEKNGEWVLQ